MAFYARLRHHNDSDDDEHSSKPPHLNEEQHFQQPHTSVSKPDEPSPLYADLIALDDGPSSSHPHRPSDPGAQHSPPAQSFPSCLSAPCTPNPDRQAPPLHHSASQPQLYHASDHNGCENSPQQSPSGSSPAEDAPGDTACARRELVLYALPLFKDQLVYLPVSAWQEEPPNYSGLKGQVAEKLDKLQGAASDAWEAMKAKDPSTFGNKVYRLGNKVVQNQTPEERLMRNIPKQVDRVIVYHPADISPHDIMEELTQKSSSIALKASVKAAVAGLVLPIAYGIDIIVIPGPQVLTYYTLYQLYKNTSSAVGSTRLTKYIAQEGKDSHVRVNYAGDPRLDRYLTASRSSPLGVLDEDDVEDMVRDLHEHCLLEPLLALRERHLRGQSQRSKGKEYHSLAST